MIIYNLVIFLPFLSFLFPSTSKHTEKYFLSPFFSFLFFWVISPFFFQFPFPHSFLFTSLPFCATKYGVKGQSEWINPKLKKWELDTWIQRITCQKKKKELKEWNKCFNPNNFITTVKFHTIWVKKENQ